jgi:hypothetical protein
MERASDRIVAGAAVELVACDAAGRVISLRRLGAVDRLRLFKAIGAELAENPPYLGMAMLAVSVTAIDNVPVPAPATEAQVEALVHRLGDGGILAIAEALDRADAEGTEFSEPGN